MSQTSLDSHLRANTPPAWFILSSCLGDNLRAHIASTDINPRHGAYGRSYARGMAFGMGPSGSEQIEMDNVMAKTWDERDSDDDDERRR